MIVKITKGSRPLGLMRYLVGPGTANEHTDPHLVTGSPTILAWFDDAQLDGDTAVVLARELDLNRRVTGAGLEEHVWHCSLSLAADEKPVTDQGWADIVQGFMDGMDFTGTGGKAPCQWVAVHHGRSVNGNDHVHIVASRIREDGTKWHDWMDFPKAQKTARALEVRFGLQQLGGYAERGYTRAEKERGPAREPARFRLERIVRSSAVASTGEAEFVRRLRRSGLLVSARFAAGEQSVVTGYSVAERPPAGMRALWFGGGSLARDLTLPALRTRWPDSPGQVQEAAEEWWAAKRHRRIVNPGADLQSGPEAALEHALQLARARQALTGVAPDDHQTWAHLARETSGLFGAWSRATETVPGPLAHASRVLARSSHRSGMRITDPVPPPLRMAGTTAFLLAATTAPPPAVQALIMQQMLRTIRLLHDMHRSNGQLREARLINDTVRIQLAAVGAPLPEVPEPQLPDPQAPDPQLPEQQAPGTSHAGRLHPVQDLDGVRPAHLQQYRHAQQGSPEQGMER